MKNKIIRLLFLVLLTHLALILLGGPGYRLGLWGFRTGLGFVFWAVYVAPVCFVVSALLFKGQARTATINLVLSLILLAIPLVFKAKVNSVPRIHDISTDLADPPQFKWVGALRKAGDHPIAYEGATASEAQKVAYPDLKTLEVSPPVSDAFKKAKHVVTGLKWELVNEDEAAGQIEATQTSFLYGFKDDVAIRFRVVEGKTLMDVRSQSRVGISDLGANAARIRAFLKAFTEAK